MFSYISLSTNMGRTLFYLSQCFCIFWCMLEVFCFGALHIGWASLAYILKKEGFFSSGCEKGNDTTNFTSEVPTCAYQDGQLSLLYSVSTGIMIIPLVFCGTLIGRFGLVKTRILYICLFVAGCATTIASNSGTPWLLAVGLALIGSGGRVFFLSSVQKIATLKSGAFILIAALNGCYDSSAAIMLFVKIAFDAGISRWKSFAFLLGLSLTSIVSTWVIFTSKKQEDRAIEISNSEKESDESSLTNFMSATLLAGFIPAVCAGIYLELFQRKLKGSPYIRNFKTLIIGVSTVNILSVAIAILSIFYVLPVVYTSFILFPILRGLFFSVAFSFIAKLFPPGSFGVLASILDLLTYAALFAQRASIVWVQSYDNAMLHIRLVFGALSIIAMFHPILMWTQMRQLSKVDCLQDDRAGRHQ